MRQTNRTQRRLAAGAFFVIAAPVALGSVAYACQSLATLHANPGTVAAGSSVTLYGKNYNATAGDGRASGAGTGSSNIVVHLDTRDGTAIASFAPPADRSINASVTIPAGTAVGDHILVATQYTAAGDAVSGTPGRASLAITVAARTTADGAAAAPASASSATPAVATAVTPAAAPTAASPASAASASTATAPAATSTAAATRTAPSAATAAPMAAAGATTASGAVAATATTPAGPAAPDAAAATPTAVNVGGILPAAASHGSSLPGLTLVAGLALVVLALGAFIKSGKSMLGRGFAPLAG